MDEGYGDLLTGHFTGELGLAEAVLGIGTVYRPGCGHITPRASAIDAGAP